MWMRNTYANLIDIVPQGEEREHIPEPACECRPEQSRSDDGIPMLIHNSFDGREFFEQAEAMLPKSYQYRRAA